MATAAVKTMVPRACMKCHRDSNQAEGLFRCGACKEVHYCHKEHQKQDWKVHKTVCKYVREHPASLWIEVMEGEGSGLANRMTVHTFSNKAEGLDFLGGVIPPKDCSPPVRSPFAELLGYNLEMYFERDAASRVLNAAGVYLTCELRTGVSALYKLGEPHGRIYVTGRRIRDGKPLVSDALWGIMNFIWDAMDYYEAGMEDPRPLIAKDAERYRRGEWQPRGGRGGANIYAETIDQCNLWK